MEENREELALYRSAPRFVPAGQSTQMIIGATPENDFQIMSVAESLYKKFDLKRVFYSAFVRVNDDLSLIHILKRPSGCAAIVCSCASGGNPMGPWEEKASSWCRR